MPLFSKLQTPDIWTVEPVNTNRNVMSGYSTDTIVAIATPPGKGGIGIVRVSGPETLAIAHAILRFKPKARYAHYCPFYEAPSPVANKQQLDEGIALYFPAPNSFTGEDILEFQAHGGPVVLDILMQQLLTLGARLARPGEFSERAFVNNKMDLVQAEAVADLIEATSEQAARSALRSLQGEFSRLIEDLVEQITQLRIYVEAAIDFPEEEIDFLNDGRIRNVLADILSTTDDIFLSARHGSLIREGMTVVIAGPPNAGKSSLLNALAGKESAIVTEIEGTTRDVLREHIHIDGMPLHIVDTAGLRNSQDVVEQIGIERAWQEIDKADRILFLIDSTKTESTQVEAVWPEFYDRLSRHNHITLIRNKVDLSGEAIGIETRQQPVIRLSAKKSDGIDLLRTHLKECVGFEATAEAGFLARRRHIDAIQRGREHICQAQDQLASGAGELVAEELKLAQNQLAEITGTFSSDDLLGRIFTSFCIGK